MSGKSTFWLQTIFVIRTLYRRIESCSCGTEDEMASVESCFANMVEHHVVLLRVDFFSQASPENVGSQCGPHRPWDDVGRF